MKSKNKPRQKAAESEHADALANMDCVVCDAPGPSEVHEPEQGLWFASMPLCFPCHRGPEGWHGNRLRWKLRRINELQAINKTIQRVKENKWASL